MKLNIKPLVDSKCMNRNQLSKELKIGYQAAFNTLENLCHVLNCTPNDILIFDTKDDTK